jgi:hypothetical protein
MRETTRASHRPLAVMVAAAARRRTSQGTGRAWSEGVDAAVEGLVSHSRGLEPVAHGVTAHEARADFLARLLVEKFLLIGDREMAVAGPGVIT